MNTLKKKKGFASMSPEETKAIASMGGRKVSQNKDHMAMIGRKGGMASGHKRGKLNFLPTMSSDQTYQ